MINTLMPKPMLLFVYIMTNRPRSHVLYFGMTNDLVRRTWEHKNKVNDGFTSRYNLTRIVYYERFFYPDAAIAREKEIKGWRRSKKIKLIESMNPRWDDLAERWQDTFKPESNGAPRKIPPHAGENAGVRDDATCGLEGAVGNSRKPTVRSPLPLASPVQNRD